MGGSGSGRDHENLSAEERAKLEEEESERLLALQEAEQLRKRKHGRLEEEREKMRQSVRQKYNIRRPNETIKPEDNLRRQQEAEMAGHIAAMDPRNGGEPSKRPILEAANQAAIAAEQDADEDFATKLMSGNVSGAAAQVATKVQSLLPQNFNVFKKD